MDIKPIICMGTPQNYLGTPLGVPTPSLGTAVLGEHVEENCRLLFNLVCFIIEAIIFVQHISFCPQQKYGFITEFINEHY